MISLLTELASMKKLASGKNERLTSGADPGLILGCRKILQKKLNIEMM